MLKNKQHGLKRAYMIKGLLFLLPAVLVYLFFAVIPVFDSIMLSFQKWNGFSARSFIGWINYIKVFQDAAFLIAIKNSVS